MVSAATATAKKTSAAPKKPRSHPPYAEMITEAIMALKERTGSSQVAIAKFIEEKHKDLPTNFRKLLLVQLKKLVASGKLTKIKGSFKVSPAVKPTAAAAAAKAKKKPTTAATTTTTAGKAKAVAPKKKKVVVKKPKAAAAATPVKKAAKKPVTAPAKVKKTPVKAKTPVKKAKAPAKKVVKKPKSIKATPAAKKAKK